MKLKDLNGILCGHLRMELQYPDGSSGQLNWSKSMQAWRYDDDIFTDEQLLELTVLEIHPDSCCQLYVVLTR